MSRFEVPQKLFVALRQRAIWFVDAIIQRIGDALRSNGAVIAQSTIRGDGGESSALCVVTLPQLPPDGFTDLMIH